MKTVDLSRERSTAQHSGTIASTHSPWCPPAETSASFYPQPWADPVASPAVHFPHRPAHGTQRRFSLTSSCGHWQPCLHFHTSWLSHLCMAWPSKPAALFTILPLAKSRYPLVITYTHPAQFLRKTCGTQTRGPGIPHT